MIDGRYLTKFEKDLLRDTYSRGTENTRKRLREMYKGLITF